MKKNIAMLLAALMLSAAAVTVSADEATDVQGNIVNLVESGTPVYGGEAGGNFWHAFDGSLKTYASFSDTNSWIGIQLEYPAVFSHVKVAAQDMNADGIPDRFHALPGTFVEGSNDGENWEYILDMDGLEAEDYSWTVEDGESLFYTEYAETEKAYSYFRVYNNGSGAPAWAEIEFYGTPTGAGVEDPTPAAAERTKDGLTANLAVTEDGANPGRGALSLGLTNNSGGCISDVTVEINLPDALAFDEGEAVQTVAIGEGETATVVAKIRHTDLPAPETEAVETVGTAETNAPSDVAGDDSSDEKGGWILPAAIAAALVVIAVVVLLLARKKKGAVSCLILCGILLGSFALPTSAAATERSMTLTCYFEYNGQHYPIEVTIRYNYTFTEANAKETDGMKRFEITYFYGPHNAQMIDETFYQRISEAGFTSIPLEYDNTELNKQALPLLRKYGLTCSALSDARIAQTIGYDRTFSPDTPQEEVDRIISEVVADYADYMDVIEGWLLQDEPCEARFEILGKVVAAFRKYSPDKTTMINLFPDYAGPDALGTKDYQEYLDEFVAQVDPHYLSYDHYHFLKDGTARGGFFTNLESVRAKAQESGIDPMIIILLTQHMGYTDVTYNQLMWEVNTSLTYGMKRISYFTFILEQYLLDDGWTNACMSYTGEIWPHYYDVQKLNAWLLPLGNELFDKNSTAVFHLMERDYMMEKGCDPYKGYGDLGEVVGKDFVIGFFDDGSFMITNKLWLEGEEGKNTLEFIDIKGGLEYFDPTASEWKAADGIAVQNENGNLTVTFDGGEGILFRIAE